MHLDDLTNLGGIRIASESDVEQKLIINLLTSEYWLGIPLNFVHTKHYLPPSDIDKGAGRRVGYFPDYSVWIDSIPVLIIEAKSPNESYEEGFREAQLYAHALNKAFETGINPVSFVLSTNGKTLRYGPWDTSIATDIHARDLCVGTAAHEKLRLNLHISVLRILATQIRSRLRPTQSFRVVDQMGGEPALNRRLGINDFATELARPLHMFFDSDATERMDEIIERAYVSTEELTRYDQIFETFLRDNITQIQNPTARAVTTGRDSEGRLTPELRQYVADLPINGRLQLIIGSVGAGKSLFCRRYYRFLQPDDIRAKVHWAFIDFNDASSDLTKAEDWVCSQFVASYAREHPDLDLYDDTTLHRVFAPDINQLEKIYRKAKDSILSAGRCTSPMS